MEKRCYVCQKIKNIDEFYKANDKIYNICLHDRNRLYCKKHNKKKSRCKECGGKDICKHNKEKYDCEKCSGSGICNHGSRKRNCRDCKGSQICVHDRQRSKCKDCKGSQICEHEKYKYLCKLCNGKGLCEHKINRKVCKICNPIDHLISLQRRRINSIVRDTVINKKNKTIEYLGCTPDFLYDYIAKQLTPEMKEKGYDIDHIKPIKKFDLKNEDELKKCLHYTNLRPLISIDNKRKSDKWTDEDEINLKKLLSTRVSASSIV